MRAIIRLAAAQPSRVADRVLEALGEPPADSPEGAAAFEAPDGLRVTGDVAWVARAFELAGEHLDLPPRLRAEADLPEIDSSDEGCQARLLDLARIAAARHAPKARFTVQLGGVEQVVAAWLDTGLDGIRAPIADDLSRKQLPLEVIRVSLGPGDAHLELDLGRRRFALEARDVAALELHALACACVEDAPAFQEAQATLTRAAAVPSEAAAPERRELEAVNLALRTRWVLASADGDAVAGAVEELGVPRVRGLLERSVAEPLGTARRQQALEALPTPGRARAIVRLLLDSWRLEGFDPLPWMDALAKEPEPAAIAAYEELLLAGVVPAETSRRLGALDPGRAAKALARAVIEGNPDIREGAAEALVALGPDLAAEALDPPPDSRRGLEASWAVVRRLLDGGGRAVGRLLSHCYDAAMRLADADPAARFLAGEISQVRGDLEGAARYYDEAAERSGDRVLKARARLASASLAFQAGRIEEAVQSWVELVAETEGEDAGSARASLARCFQELTLPDFAALCESEIAASRLLGILRGWLAGRHGRFPEAVEHFRGADEVDPLTGGPARSYAASLRAAGDEGMARKVLQRVVEATPQDAESAYQLARLLHDAGEGPAALAPLEKSLEVRPEFGRAHHLRGLIHEEGGEPERAADAYRKAIGAAEPLPAAFTGLARASMELGRLEEAAEIYRRSLDVGPECRLPGFRELGRLYQDHLGDPEQALFWFQRYLTEGGEDEEVLARFKKLAAEVESYPRTMGGGGS
jgi:tetratricopeptide (TPR) repeat protein